MRENRYYTSYDEAVELRYYTMTDLVSPRLTEIRRHLMNIHSCGLEVMVVSMFQIIYIGTNTIYRDFINQRHLALYNRPIIKKKMEVWKKDRRNMEYFHKPKDCTRSD